MTQINIYTLALVSIIVFSLAIGCFIGYYIGCISGIADDETPR